MQDTAIRLGLLALVLGASEFGAASVVSAQRCTVDSDCESGSCRPHKQIECRYIGCGASGAGAGDADAGCELEQVCEAVTYYGSCDPVVCTGDADCRPGMLCMEKTFSFCPIVDPCPGQTSCPVDPDDVDEYPGVCHEEVYDTCIARTSLPCEEDRDCGDGFSCLSGPADNYCQLHVLPCSADADCPELFSCEANPCIGGTQPYVCRPPDYLYVGCPPDPGAAGTGGGAGTDAGAVDGGAAGGEPAGMGGHGGGAGTSGHGKRRHWDWSHLGCSIGEVSGRDSIATLVFIGLCLASLIRRRCKPS